MIKFLKYACLASLSLSIFVAVPVTAQSAKAKQNPARSVDVSKIFGYYDLYLRLPPSDRDGFRMVYTLRSRENGARPQLAYSLGATRIPIEVAPNGQILTMPDLAMYQRGKVEIAAGQPSASINLDLQPTLTLARTINAADAQNPINDYAASLRRAGPLSLIAPKLNGLTFKGVTSGEAIFPDGRRIVLPTGNGGVVYRPSLPALRGATAIAFPNAPTFVEFAQQ